MAKNQIQKLTSDGTYSRWDMGAYVRFLSVRQIPSYNEIVDHPLVGVFFISDSGKRVTIERVRKQWYAGFYYLGVYVDDTGSHGTIVIENINSEAPGIHNSLKRFNEMFIHVPFKEPT